MQFEELSPEDRFDIALYVLTTPLDGFYGSIMVEKPEVDPSLYLMTDIHSDIFGVCADLFDCLYTDFPKARFKCFSDPY